MERIRRLVQEANNTFRTADHLACVGYPLLRDKRMLLAIANKLYAASLSGIGAVLNHEKINKKIGILPLDAESRMDIFKNEVANRIGVSQEFCRVVDDLRFITDSHKESVVEFSRGEQFILCNEDYSNMKSVDIEMLKSHMNIVRVFLRKINEVYSNV